MKKTNNQVLMNVCKMPIKWQFKEKCEIKVTRLFEKIIGIEELKLW